MYYPLEEIEKMKNNNVSINHGGWGNLLFVLGWVAIFLSVIGTWGCGSSSSGGGADVVDTTPDAFAFTAVTDMDVDVPVYSNEVIVTGSEEEAGISIMGGDGAYSINGGMYTSEDGTVYEGDTVVVRLTASRYNNTVVASDVTIGGLSSVFSVATGAADLVDTIPDAFEFSEVIDARLTTLTYSNEITVTGFEGGAELSISGAGEYSVNGSVFTRNEGMISAGDTVKVRLTSSTYFGTTVSTTMTIGGLPSVFSVSTWPLDTTPDPFTFTAVTHALDLLPYNSNEITVTGITAETDIHIADDPVNPPTIGHAQYSINGGPWTLQAGTVREGDKVRVIVVSSIDFGKTVSAQLTIGGVSAVFSVKTI